MKDQVFLRSEARRVLIGNSSECRGYPEGLLEPNSGTFHFVGKPVGYRFLEYSLTFSRDLQRSVKVDMALQRESILCFLRRLAHAKVYQMTDS